jgi:hypothetical protein
METLGVESYPVLWSEPDGLLVAGSLTPALDALRFEGARDGRLVERTVSYRDLDGVRIGRTAADRLHGRPTLVVERRDGPELLVLPLGAGLLLELAELVAELCAASTRPVEQIAVVLPLKPEMVETARALVAEGPPFDPDDKSLDRHEIFVTANEAIFVFFGADACASVREIMRDGAVWSAASRWTSCLAGAPRIADAGYAWPDRAT